MAPTMEWSSLNTTDEKLEYLYQAQQTANNDLDNLMFLVLGSNVYCKLTYLSEDILFPSSSCCCCCCCC